MPTLLDLCDLAIPETVDGFTLAGQQRRDHLYGEHSEGAEATRMIRSGSSKLIYYPTGNQFQLFDIENDPRETTDLSGDPGHLAELDRLTKLLIQSLYGGDEDWVKDGRLLGLPEKELNYQDNRGLVGQRGLRFV